MNVFWVCPGILVAIATKNFSGQNCPKTAFKDKNFRSQTFLMEFLATDILFSVAIAFKY